MIRSCIFLFLVLANIHLLSAQTVVPNGSTVSGLWKLQEAPFLVQGMIRVEQQDTLIIEPGVEVRFRSSADTLPATFDFDSALVGAMEIQGVLMVMGNDNQPVVFTRDSIGSWGVLLINNQTGLTSILENCVVEHARELRNVPNTTTTSFRGAVSVNSAMCDLNRCSITDNTFSGVLYRYGARGQLRMSTIARNATNGIVCDQSVVSITNNRFYENSVSGMARTGAVFSYASDIHVTGNLIYQNHMHGSLISATGNAQVVNNTFFRNEVGLMADSSVQIAVSNSIFFENSNTFSLSDLDNGSIIFSHCMIDDSQYPSESTDVINSFVGTDPLFINGAANDFTVASGSVAIDAGTPDTTGLLLPTTDLLGNPRIVNTVDIGAVEFQDNPTGVEDLHRFGSSFMIYPNPCAEQLFISPEWKVKGLTIYQNDGQMVRKTSSITTIAELDVSMLATGLYLLVAETETGTHTARFSVQ